MLGKNEGVAAKLSRICTYPFIVNHCVAHRLALAFKESKNNDGQELYKQLTSWKMLAFLYYFYDILEHVTKLSKFLQKRNLKFSDIDPMIQATINSIQKEYILIDQNQRFGQKVQMFI